MKKSRNVKKFEKSKKKVEGRKMFNKMQNVEILRKRWNLIWNFEKWYNIEKMSKNCENVEKIKAFPLKQINFCVVTTTRLWILLFSNLFSICFAFCFDFISLCFAAAISFWGKKKQKNKIIFYLNDNFFIYGRDC